MNINDERSWNQLVTIKRETLGKNGGQIPTSWVIISDDDGTKIYEGFLWYKNPYGSGTEYHKNGIVFRKAYGISRALSQAENIMEMGSSVLRECGGYIWLTDQTHRFTAVSLMKKATFCTAASFDLHMGQ